MTILYMDNNKETLSLEVLHAESDKTSLVPALVDSEISSWNNIKQKSLKIPDFPIEIPSALNDSTNLPTGLAKNPHTRPLNMSNLPSPRYGISKATPKSYSKVLPKHKNPDIKTVNVNDALSTTPFLPCNVYILPKSKGEIKLVKNKKFTPTHKMIEIVDFSNRTMLGEIPHIFKHANHMNNTVVKRFKCKSQQKEKAMASAQQRFYINLDVSDKVIEIISKSRSPSPSTRVTTSGWQNKLPIYAAKTLEELLACSKLPEIRSRKNKFRSKKNL